MKKVLPVFAGLLFSFQLNAQDFTGQWKGEFIDKSTSFGGWGGDHCEYILELECKGTSISGYSYTYFNEGGKRYYTICKLTGTYKKTSKQIEVWEIDRTKTNVPNNIRNCFQLHRLTYSKEGDEQILEGTWSPAPNQAGDCGYGTTTLSRRILLKNPEILAKPLEKPVKPVIKTPLKPIETVKNKNLVVKPPVKQVSPPLVNKLKPRVDSNFPVKSDTPVNLRSNPVMDEQLKKSIAPNVEKMDQQPIISTNSGFVKRNNTLLKTIEIENKTFRVDLYDNGEVDGDSISLFFNGRLLLQHQRLSEKAISLTINADDRKDVNELIMYAENLGEIPPNTALMVVTDGDNRYEVHISSDLEQSGVIRFVYKPKTGQ